MTFPRFSLLAACLFPVAAFAQDMDWTGTYAGLQTGQGNFDLSDNQPCTGICPAILVPGPDEVSSVGVFAGYLHDFGQVVVGAELDYGSFDVSLADLNFGEPLSPAVVQENRMLRGKLIAGYDAGRVLPYATVGLGQLSGDSFDDNTATIIGAGALVQVTDRILVGGEVLRHTFETSFSPGYTGGAIDVATTASVRIAFRF